MVDTVSTQTLVSGAKNLVIKMLNASDGTGESAIKKVDASDHGATTLKIMKIHAATFGMGVDILFDATTDLLAWHIPADTVMTWDFTCFGGLINNAGSGVTQDINVTTIGHSAGDRYSIVLEMVKD